MVNKSKLKLAITIGDPAGVGPEIVLKAMREREIRALAEWKIVGDRNALLRTAASCSLGGLLSDASFAKEVEIVDPHLLDGVTLTPGAMKAEYGAAAMQYVRIATEMCLYGETQGMVTAPLNKEAVTLSGIHFSGHTEYIAQLCGAKEPRMLLSSERLSVIHVSTHIALREAVNLKQERILSTIELGDEAMRFLGKQHPRIAVCGLNPHAGEHGLFGKEDEKVIAPAIAEAQRRGIACEGPAAPDTVFLKGARGAYDLIVAMYHDQGHIPMKLLDFERTVNISLGIPIVRTSVDHGTAFDIAGRNCADARNMIAALRTCTKMAEAKLALQMASFPERK